MLKKDELCRIICKKIRVTRKDPFSNTLTKRELMMLNAYLDTAKDSIEAIDSLAQDARTMLQSKKVRKPKPKVKRRG